MSDHGYRVLLTILEPIPRGAHVTADTCRPEFDMAQIGTADRGAAFQAAARAGYLRGTDRVVRSQVESRKNGATRVWIRTAKPVPAHVCREVS